MIMEGMWQAGVLHNELSLYGKKKIAKDQRMLVIHCC